MCACVQGDSVLVVRPAAKQIKKTREEWIECVVDFLCVLGPPLVCTCVSIAVD
jgi:hypothetical protein